jgi:hypothetical protein
MFCAKSSDQEVDQERVGADEIPASSALESLIDVTHQLIKALASSASCRQASEP